MFSTTHLLIILAIVIIIFGAKKLRDVGGDLGAAIRNFKKSMSDEHEKQANDQASGDTKQLPESGRVIDADVTSKQKTKKKV